MIFNASAIPIPSEVTLPFAGFLSNQGSLSFILVILLGFAEILVGSLIGYAIGYFLEEKGKIFIVLILIFRKIMG